MSKVRKKWKGLLIRHRANQEFCNKFSIVVVLVGMCFWVKTEGEQSQIPSLLPSLLHVAFTLEIKKEKGTNAKEDLLTKCSFHEELSFMDGNVVNSLDRVAGLLF